MIDLPRMRVRLIRAVRAARNALFGVRAVPQPETVNGFDVLEKVVRLPISTWSYTFDPETRHLGPMAQDFYAAFGFGHSDRRIYPLDSSGVSLVAIQALHRMVADLRAEVEVLRRDLQAMSG